MSRFYLTLPSNSSMEYYPENTVARYTTKLNSQIELEGDWEVGLTEISIPSEVANVVEGHCYYNIYLSNVLVRKIVLKQKHYERMRNIIRDLHEEQRNGVPLQDHEPLLVKFSYIPQSEKFRMVLERRYVAVEFSPDLARLLGFDSDVKYSREEMTGRRLPNLIGQIHSVYVYCDLLEHVPVGDTTAPLLRIVDKPVTTHGNVHQVLNPTLYVPLQKKNFDTVEINIMTDTGVVVPFLMGKSFIVLEFRRAVHPYFSI